MGGKEQIFLIEEFQIVNGKGMREIENHHKNAILAIPTGKIHK